MENQNSAKLDAVDFVPETLQDAMIFGTGGQKIGRVSHVHGLGTDSKVVVDVGGYLDVDLRSVMLDAKDMTFTRNADEKVHGVTSMTKAQIMALPNHAQ